MTIINGGNSDDTPEIQAAIASTGYVELLPRKTYNVSSLNLTNTQGVTIKGAGTLSTFINPILANANVIDLCGASNATLEGFIINASSACVPMTGILNAQIQGGHASDVTHIINVRVDGHYSLAAWYNLGVESSFCSGGQFYNYQPGCITVIHTGNNFFGAASQFVTINNANNIVPSDWTFIATEMHNYGSAQAFWMGGTSSYRYYGGNISSSVCPVDMNAVTINGANQGPQFVIFDGTTFYADNPPSPPVAIRQGNAFGVITRGNSHGGMALTS